MLILIVDLHIERMCLTGGSTPVPHYLEAYNVSLFLTSYPEEVERALESGMYLTCVYNLYITCIQSVYNLYTTCIQSVYNLYTICI